MALDKAKEGFKNSKEGFEDSKEGFEDSKEGFEHDDKYDTAIASSAVPSMQPEILTLLVMPY